MPTKKAAGRTGSAVKPDPVTSEDPTPAAGRRPRAEKRRVAGDVIRSVRRSLGYTREELRDYLRVGSASLARYELTDAPPWMSYALIGIGVLERGVPVDEMIRRVVAEEEAAGAGTTRSRGGEVSLPRRKPPAAVEPSAAPRPATSKRAPRGVSKRAAGGG